MTSNAEIMEANLSSRRKVKQRRCFLCGKLTDHPIQAWTVLLVDFGVNPEDVPITWLDMECLYDLTEMPF
jgi:hypothetical protein